MEFYQKIAHANRRLFSPLQEDLIAQWILDSEREGTPRTRKDVVEFAGLIAAQDGESPYMSVIIGLAVSKETSGNSYS